MLQPATLKFLQSLQKNNNKEWFEKNRTAYDNAKSDFTGFVEKLIPVMSGFDKTLSSLQAKQCLFRINRDVRFSKDKRPYKNNMAAYFNKDGKKALGSGYYLHIEPGKSFAAAGIWMPEPAVLAKIRQEIDYNFDEWKKLLAKPSFKKCFPKGLDDSEVLSRPPKGYAEDNPAITFLKRKSFVVMYSFSDKEILDKTFLKKLGTVYAATQPLIDFLNRAID